MQITRPLRKVLRALGILLGVLLVPYAGLAAPSSLYSAGADPGITLKDDRLTIQARGASLERIVQDIAGKSSFVIDAHVPLTETIGISLENMPLEKALKWILRDYNNVFLYAPQKKGEPKISKIIIFSRITPEKPSMPGMNVAARTPAAGPGAGGTQGVRSRPEQHSAIPADAKNGEAIHRISRDLSRGKDENTKIRAVQNLDRMGDDMAFVPLIQALYDENPRVSQNALEALGRMKNDNVAVALRGFMSDSNPRVRRITQEALQKMEGR